MTPKLQTEKLRILKDDLYENIYLSYTDELKDEMQFIPKYKRNENLVLVFATQIINLNHGPSKMLFDRCYTISKHLKKQVFLINTAELMTPLGAMESWFNYAFGNYIKDYSEAENIRIRDIEVPIFQCPQIMPDVNIIKMIMSVVKEKKPWCAVTIGDVSIVSDMCAKLIPVLTLPTVYSGIACTRSQFQMKTGDLTDEDIRWMNKHSYTEEHFVKEFFTFTFKEQTHNYERAELSLPEEGKIAIVCSGRLDSEVDDSFMSLV